MNKKEILQTFQDMSRQEQAELLAGLMDEVKNPLPGFHIYSRGRRYGPSQMSADFHGAPDTWRDQMRLDDPSTKYMFYAFNLEGDGTVLMNREKVLNYGVVKYVKHNDIHNGVFSLRKHEPEGMDLFITPKKIGGRVPGQKFKDFFK